MLQRALSVKKATILRNHSSSDVIRLKILQSRLWIGGLKVPNETARSPLSLLWFLLRVFFLAPLFDRYLLVEFNRNLDFERLRNRC
jgi:hypothetical protein